MCSTDAFSSVILRKSVADQFEYSKGLPDQATLHFVLRSDAKVMLYLIFSSWIENERSISVLNRAIDERPQLFALILSLTIYFVLSLVLLSSETISHFVLQASDNDHRVTLSDDRYTECVGREASAKLWYVATTLFSGWNDLSFRFPVYFFDTRSYSLHRRAANRHRTLRDYSRISW